MTHHSFSRVLYVVMVAVVFTTSAVIYIASASPVKALGFFQPFSGYETAVIPNLTLAGLPNPACPIYTTITNTDITNGLPPVFGIYIPITLPGITYDYNNLFTPGTPIIGGIVPIPNVACLAPIPVYPLYYDAPFYLAGTGGIPGTR